MRSKDTVYYIALALWYKHGDKVITEQQIETEITAIAGEDNRTFTKYKNLLIQQGYIDIKAQGKYTLPQKPDKPKSPKQYVESLKAKTEG